MVIVCLYEKYDVSRTYLFFFVYSYSNNNIIEIHQRWQMYFVIVVVIVVNYCCLFVVWFFFVSTFISCGYGFSHWFVRLFTIINLSGKMSINLFVDLDFNFLSTDHFIFMLFFFDIIGSSFVAFDNCWVWCACLCMNYPGDEERIGREW